MAQLQWLGTVPPRQKSMVGEAIKGGVESYMGEREKAKEREVRLEEISYDKKVKGANLIMDAKKHMNDAQAAELDATPKVRELFKDLGWPYPEGSLMAAPTIKFQAIEALQKGQVLEGMSMDETKKAAGVLVSENKITSTDITAFEKTVPMWEKLLPGKQKTQKEVEELKRKYKSQFGGIKAGTTGDPLGVR